MIRGALSRRVVRRKVAAAGASIVVAAVILAFFYAPVVFWYNADGGPVISGMPRPANPVYRSLGCIYTGYGATYAPYLGGFMFGCEGPIVPLY